MSMKLPFFNRQTEDKQVDPLNVPNHVAIIMDGNGRWAKKRGLPRIAGHKEGLRVVKEIAKSASDCGIKILTLYAFSTENWKRPKSEVDFIMRLPKDFLHKYLPELIENNVKIETIGEFDTLPEFTKEAVQYAKDQTRENNGLLLNFALNYGSRFEINRAIGQIVRDIELGKIDLESLDENNISHYLYTRGLPDPDLLIRTGGEQRLSNFLLWQLAYTEFWFTNVHWPEFNQDVFLQALCDYQQRKRRFGGI